MMYFYNGPVYRFDDTVANHWKCTTEAPTLSRAISNMIYRYKSEHGLSRSTNVRIKNRLVNTGIKKDPSQQ